MRFRMPGAMLAMAAALSLCVSPALAQQSYVVKAGDSSLQNFASLLLNGVQYPEHLMMGMHAGAPTAMSVDGSGNVNVNVVSAGSTTITGSLPGFAATPAFTISGTLPGFASTPAFSLTGTLPAFASTPAFTLSGTLPGFASTPTFNCGTGCSGQGAWNLVGLTNITVGTASAATALPTSSTNLWLINTGSSTVDYALGTTSGVTATTSSPSLAGGACTLLTYGSNTYIATIVASGSGALQVQSGTGAPLGCGGGGGGSGGAVTAADGALVTMGSLTDGYAGTYIGSFSAIALLKGAIYQLQQIVSNQGNASAVNQGTNPWLIGCNSATAVPSATAAGSPVGLLCSKEGKAIIRPFAPEDFSYRGYAATSTAVSGSPQTFTGWTAPGTGLSAYVTSVQCGRDDTGTSTVWVTFNDTVSTTIAVPGNGGATNISFQTPLKVSASATAPSFYLSGAVSGGTKGVGCSAQGYAGN